MTQNITDSAMSSRDTFYPTEQKIGVPFHQTQLCQHNGADYHPFQIAFKASVLVTRTPFGQDVNILFKMRLTYYILNDAHSYLNFLIRSDRFPPISM